MFLADYIRLQDTGTGLQRIYRRVNTLLYDLSGKYRGGIQMSKCCRGSRVCQVVCRNVYVPLVTPFSTAQRTGS